jgi:hypothetical protein
MNDNPRQRRRMLVGQPVLCRIIHLLTKRRAIYLAAGAMLAGVATG